MKKSYTDKVVIFLDILGFKEIINTKDSNEVLDILNFIKGWFKKDNYLYLDIYTSTNITQFSDSIIVSFAYNEESQLFNILINFRFFIIEIFEKFKVLLRGGISLGKVYHDSEYVFGPAFNEAYSLESSKAEYPRILISSDVVDICSNYGRHESEIEKDYLNEIIKKDIDSSNGDNSYYYLDYISYDSIHSEFDNPEEGYYYFYIELLSFLNESIKKNKENNKVVNKLNWLKKELLKNSTVVKKIKESFSNKI